MNQGMLRAKESLSFSLFHGSQTREISLGVYPGPCLSSERQSAWIRNLCSQRSGLMVERGAGILQFFSLLRVHFGK